MLNGIDTVGLSKSYQQTAFTGSIPPQYVVLLTSLKLNSMDRILSSPVVHNGIVMTLGQMNDYDKH